MTWNRNACARRVGWLALAGAVLSIATPAPAGSPVEGTPDAWIERMNQALLPGKSMTAKAELVTTDRTGASSRLEFDFARLTDERGVDRTLIEVTGPEEGKGTFFQIVAQPGEALQSWIWSPAVGRLRRIAGIHRTDAFLGSEFTYEDLGLAAPLERRTGDAREVTEDGRRLVRLDSGPYHYYGRVETYLDPENGMPTRVVFYDRAGYRFREQRFGDVQEIDGHPFPATIEVEDRLTGTRSRLTFGHVAFDVEIPRETWDQSIIGRKLRRGFQPDVPTPVE